MKLHHLAHCTRLTAPRAMGLALAIAIALGTPAPAAADTRGSDIVLGATAEEQGLTAVDLPDITAPRAIAVDGQGNVIFERNADEQCKIASVTKVMTAIVAVENAPLDATITVDQAAADLSGATCDVEAGDTLTLEEALKGLLIPSGNDAATAIANSVGALIDPESDDPYLTFMDAMNEKALELGMTDSYFENPHGLDSAEWTGQHHATARDVATMVRCAMENETIRSIVGAGDTTMRVTSASGTERTIELEDTNALVGENGNIGTKTGETRAAGLCFAGTWVREDTEITTVVLGCANKDIRFTDSLALADWYFDHHVETPVVNTERTCADGAPLAGRVAATAWTDKTVDVTTPEDQRNVWTFDLAGEVTSTVELHDLKGGVSAGDVAGTATVSQAGETIASVDLVAAEDVPAPNPFEWVLVQFDRLVRMVTGEAAQAETVTYATEVPVV